MFGGGACGWAAVLPGNTKLPAGGPATAAAELVDGADGAVPLGMRKFSGSEIEVVVIRRSG